jgi:hypothetical protein
MATQDFKGTLNGWIPEYKMGTLTRNMEAVSGAVATASIGFKPSIVFFFAVLANDHPFSIGVDRVTDKLTLLCYAADTMSTSNTYAITIFTDGSTGQRAYLASLDTDGFTLQWELNGTPAAGSADIRYLAIR